MPHVIPATHTRIDPAFPLLWRSSDTIQVGIDSNIRFAAEEPWVELLLSKMAAGFRRSAFDVIAHSVHAPRGASRDLLTRLEPLLIDDPGPLGAAWVESINAFDPRAEHHIRDALHDEGIAPGERKNRQHIGIVAVHSVAASLDFARYLREDIAHVPVAFENARTTVGPLITPGETPCLSCRDAHSRDRDSAWPLMHSQLIGRKTETVTIARAAEAAMLVAQVLARRQEIGSFVVVTPDGHRAWQRLTFHEECQCRELLCQSPPRTARAPFRPGPLSATTTNAAFARPA